MISIEDFHTLDIRVGTVLTAKINRKARIPAYAMTIDFGALGVLQTSAQIAALYAPEDLIGKQLVCCVNLKPLYVGLVKSRARVLAAESAEGFVLIRPETPAKNGDLVR